MKHHYSHRPLQKHRTVSSLAFACLFISFLLLLLVALSLPIIKSIYIVSVKSVLDGGVITSVATELRFGVWGVCASSDIDQPLGLFDTKTGICFGPQLGYTIPDSIAKLSGVSPSIVHAVEKGLLAVLVLHPIAAGLSFIGFFFSLFLASHGVAIFCLLVTTVTALLTTIVFAIDLAVVIIVRKEITDVSGFNFDVNFGPAVWMVLVAFLLSWIAVFILSARACYCCGVRKSDREYDHNHHNGAHHNGHMEEVNRNSSIS